MKIANIQPFEMWLRDLKSGELIKHQPKRKQSHSKWFVNQRISEGRALKA